jgi:hypothetical protein
MRFSFVRLSVCSREEDAISLADKNLALAERFYKPESLFAVENRSALVMFLDTAAQKLWENDQYDKAVPLYNRLIKILDSKAILFPAVNDAIDLDDELVYLEECLEALGRKAEAAEIEKRRSSIKN